MATENLNPNADGTTKQWTKSGGTYHYENVDEGYSSANGDTDYLYADPTSVELYEQLGFQSPSSMNAGHTCTNINFRGYCKYIKTEIDYPTVSIYYRVSSGSWVYVGDWYITTSSYSWFTCNKNVSLTKAEIDTLEIQMVMAYDPWDDCSARCSTVDCVITYSANSITVINPASATQWSVGTQYNITWSKVGSIATFEIDLYKPSGTFVTTIANAATGTSYPWTVPSLTAGTNYNVKIEDTAYSTTYDYSDAFEIVVSVPGVKKVWGINTTSISKIMGINDSNFDKFINIDYSNT